MRLDKYLKMTRLAKRRSEAKDALDAGRVELHGRPLKASHQVKVGDELVIHYARGDVRVRVDAIPERQPGKADAHKAYTVLGETAEAPR